MRKNKKMLSVLLIISVILSFSSFTYADSVSNNTSTNSVVVFAQNKVISTNPAVSVIVKPLKFNIEEAVKTGLQNSIAIQQVENETAISELQDERAKYNQDKLENNSFVESRDSIDSAQSALNEGIAPVDITIAPGVTIPKGQNIDNYLSAIGQSAASAAVKAGVQSQINTQRNNLLAAEPSFEAAMESALSEAGSKMSDKLDFNSLDSLDLDSTTDLMTKMSGVQLEVTKASYAIYKNQIAMLIKKCYYDVLKAKKMLEVKQRAVDRAKKQYDYSQDGFNSGMKAKDDVLLASIYYKGTQIELQKAQGDLNNAMIGLKNNMGVPMESQIELTDVLADKVESQKLDEGLKSGLVESLDMKKALGEVVVYNATLADTAKKYPENTFQYREAALLKEKAKLNFTKTAKDVESSIRQSYETLTSTGQMLETAKEMVEQAKESLEISQYRYAEGYGTSDSALLKKLDIESTSGTIVEVLAEEENLSQVEEKVVEITYGYNMAKMKYLNDIGKFIY